MILMLLFDNVLVFLFKFVVAIGVMLVAICSALIYIMCATIRHRS